MTSKPQDDRPGASREDVSLAKQQFNALGGQQNNNAGNGVQFTGNIHGPVYINGRQVEGLELEQKAREEKVLDKRRTALLQSLAPDTSSDPKGTIRQKVEGTCEWCISHPSFKQWQDNSQESSRILWISADPGCGKSVLAKYLVDDILPSKGEQITSGFFFKDRVANQDTITAAFHSLLFQILEQRPELLSDGILRRFEIRTEALNHFQELWDLLICIAKEPSTGELICLIDALDECEESGRDHFIRNLGRLPTDRMKSGLRLKFLITSRPYIEIRREMAEVCLIHLAGESDSERDQIIREIDLVIEARVEGLGKKLQLTQAESRLLLTRLRDNPNRTYLWVHLVMEGIAKIVPVTDKSISEATAKLPRKLEEIYDEMLSKSPNPGEAKNLLQVVATAARPLTLDELKEILRLWGRTWPRKAGEDVPDERFAQTVQDMSGRFLSVVAGKVHLFHRTVKEFLMEPEHEPTDDRTTPKSGSALVWKECLSPPACHTVLAEVCIQTLLELTSRPAQDGGEPPRLSDYAAMFWASHVRQCSPRDQKGMTPAIMKICDPNGGLSAWLPKYWVEKASILPKNFTRLMAVSYFGLSHALGKILRERSLDANARDGTYGRSALSWASGNGHVAAVRQMTSARRALYLLSRFEADSLDRQRRTPLVYAVWSGNLETVRLLIDAGANPAIQDMTSATPFLYAACLETKDILHLLLEKSKRFPLGANEVGYALHEAIVRHDDDAVKTLLQADDINLNIIKDGVTPLYSAASWGKDSIVDLLLQKGADVNASNDQGRTALHIAAARGNDDIIGLLIRLGADINATDSQGMTALHFAALGDWVKAIDLLLQGGANANSSDARSRTPLHFATGRDLKTEHFIFSQRDDRGGVGQSAEHASNIDLLGFLLTSSDALGLLLSKGANANAVDDRGRTALHYAVTCGFSGLVAQLLGAQRVDIEAKTSEGLTPYAISFAEQRMPLVIEEARAHATTLKKLQLHNADHRGFFLEGEDLRLLIPRFGHISLTPALENNRADMADTLQEFAQLRLETTKAPDLIPQFN